MWNTKKHRNTSEGHGNGQGIKKPCKGNGSCHVSPVSPLGSSSSSSSSSSFSSPPPSSSPSCPLHYHHLIFLSFYLLHFFLLSHLVRLDGVFQGLEQGGGRVVALGKQVFERLAVLVQQVLDERHAVVVVNVNLVQACWPG